MGNDEGRVTVFRHDAPRSVEVSGALVRLISGDRVEVLELEAAITRCKEALLGRPFHRQ